MILNYNFRNYNFRLVLYVLALNCIGLLVINSASGQDSGLVQKQALGIVLGLAVMAVISLIPYQKILTYSWGIYAGCIVILVAVLLFGRNVNGATRWIEVAGIQFQPSEFVKHGMIVFSSWFLVKHLETLNSIRTLALIAAVFAVPLALILEEPNLSTTLVIVFVLVCMVFVAGLSYKWIFGTLAVIVPVLGLLMYLARFTDVLNRIPFLQGYQITRVLAWLNPDEYAATGYQQANSIMAIGSGMLHGKGLNNNTLASVKNGNFLSEEQTDFIFAVIGEELGFIGCVAVIALFAVLVYECLIMAHRAKDMSGKLIGCGVSALLAFQTFANIAVATGIFPNTGLPLPFISYGVSSLVSMYIGLGVLLNVGLQRNMR
ncbi:MAG TPA: rod shape-determining protein RodA [Candidatus Lachnoclostridium pullistercoris]|uniref:Rod shape-determining protein RodA n=1 Tax=Candidatus Lachnoclostridium pullistercoris TaxID=2838632 RepID=A0A9D2PCK1_9FIRM|nr:rod shape-determining protein RodA [Candidatus Lachnoclostridium pullistercoris]